MYNKIVLKMNFHGHANFTNILYISGTKELFNTYLQLFQISRSSDIINLPQYLTLGY